MNTLAFYQTGILLLGFTCLSALWMINYDFLCKTWLHVLKTIDDRKEEKIQHRVRLQEAKIRDTELAEKFQYYSTALYINSNYPQIMSRISEVFVRHYSETDLDDRMENFIEDLFDVIDEFSRAGDVETKKVLEEMVREIIENK